jgi:putative transcriptional regulator
MRKKHRSDAMAAIHETMEALREVGAIDKHTMRRFDDACLTAVRPLAPEETKEMSNDADRPRKHLARFGPSWQKLQE